MRAAVVDLNKNEIDFAPLPDEVARKAYFSYLNQGSLPGHEVQHWLEHRPVKDRYDNPRDERFYVCPDGVYTVPEVADHLEGIARLPKTAFSAARADGFDLDGVARPSSGGWRARYCAAAARGS